MLDILDKIDERLMTEGEEDIVHYKGEVFKMGNMDYSGNRALLHPKNKEVVGQVKSDDSIELWGHGIERSDYKPRTYIPKVTGHEITWDDYTTGKRTGRFYPLAYPMHRIERLMTLLRKKGLGPKLKKVRGQSRYQSV